MEEIMTGKLHKTEIKGRTEEYWEQHKDDYDCYVEELIGRELTYAHSHPLDDGTPRLRRLDKPVHTLALTVGESFEPLLQVTCVLRPKRVVLILNNFYGRTPGQDHGETLKRLMMQLSKASGLPDDLRPSLREGDFDLQELDADTPTHVFRALRDAMQKPEAQPPASCMNAVDITGAKKSMVVGAFLYAAHSGLPITYVDFDKYNSDWGRPYGYTCKIGRIANPYEMFGLRNWEKVRQLYNRYNFRDAVELVTGAPEQSEVGIRKLMSRNLESENERLKLYNPDDVLKVDQLLNILRMYEAWDSGDFQTALKLADKLPEGVVPSSVTILGGNWPIISHTNATSWPTDIYTDGDKLRVYAFDELKRIKRLIQYNQDYRSAFLRAGGLSEVLMTTRIVALIADTLVRNRFLDALAERTPNAEKMFTALLKLTGVSFALNDLGLRNSPKASVTVVKPMKDWWNVTKHFCGPTGWELFLDRRNVLTHRYVAVSEELASDALSFATANFEDYIGPLESLALNGQAADWASLCQMLRLDFLPLNLLT
jgi:hypothetical protein